MGNKPVSHTYNMQVPDAGPCSLNARPQAIDVSQSYFSWPRGQDTLSFIPRGLFVVFILLRLLPDRHGMGTQ